MSSRFSPRWFRTFGLVGLPAIGLLIFGGCAAPINITSNPSGATVTANGKVLGQTSTKLEDNSKPATLEFTLDGYFSETVFFTPDGGKTTSINADLQPRTRKKTYEFRSNPEGATVVIDNAEIGVTPTPRTEVTYTRGTKTAPWQKKTMRVSKADYDTETVILDANQDSVPAVELQLLREVRTYSITANTEGTELKADVIFDGKVVGQTPYQLSVTFQRPNKNALWPVHTLSVGIQAKYDAHKQDLKFEDRNVRIAPNLKAITEILTKRIYPAVQMTPTGAELKVVTDTTLAVLREGEQENSDLKKVTTYNRSDLPDAPKTRVEGINSFCVTPDGQGVIYGRTEHDDQNRLYSNLYVQRVDATGVSQITNGNRYWDAFPWVGPDAGRGPNDNTTNYLVFTSNRGDPKRTDITKMKLSGTSPLPGIQAMVTPLQRFNYSPTFSNSNKDLFLLSIEANFPSAEPTISHMRMDSPSLTDFPIPALEVNYNIDERVFYVTLNKETGKKEIYSITPEGKEQTALMTQEEFRAANCFNPSISADGNRLLFVSDRGTDDKGRHNNDIYLAYLNNSSQIVRLTQNGSDDIMPVWSPTEDGVIFFLSNRGGAYNIWRMKVPTTSK